MSVCSPFLAVRDMDESAIKTLIQRGSGERVAFVPERSAKATLAETLLAFANSRGGIAVLGITRAGAVRGLRNPEAGIEKALSAALPIRPPRASISRTICPLATPPIEGLQDIWPIVPKFPVIRRTLSPRLAAAQAASQPACPAPITAIECFPRTCFT